MAPRRQFLALLGIFGVLLVPALQTRIARASTALRLELGALIAESRAVVVGTALEATSRWEELGSSQRIVTYTRVRVDETLLGKPQQEFVVRTLGGRVGTLGQIVHGEAPLARGKPAVLFLGVTREGTSYVAGMAQGHYPLEQDASGTRYLHASPGLDRLLGSTTGSQSAVIVLSGKALATARRLIQEKASK